MDSQSETSSCSNDQSTWGRVPTGSNLNSQSLESFPLECRTITRLISQYHRSNVDSKNVLEELKKLKSDRSKDVFAVNVENIELTKADVEVRCKGDEDDSDDAKIDPGTHELPYLKFDASALNKMSAKLPKSGNNQQMSKIAQDIEKQFTLSAFRLSKRQRKKQNAEKRKETLRDWFDMPRVSELTSEQAKDLAALRMRRVWDPKHFYKKSSQMSAGAKDVQTSEFFKIGTIVESKADFYSSRLPKRQRKATIVDELINDTALLKWQQKRFRK